MDKREELAKYAHETWSHWMKHIFSLCYNNTTGITIISKLLTDRWIRQMKTPYNELPEEEKESDRKEADKILEIINN